MQDLERQLAAITENRELLAVANEGNTALIADFQQQLAERNAALEMIARAVVPSEGEAVQDAVFRAIDSRDAALGALALALNRYGLHEDGCLGRIRKDCTCGLSTALAPDFVRRWLW